MNQANSGIEVISALSDSYAESIAPKLKVAFKSDLDTIWEINADADLYLWYGREKKYYLLRWPSGFYISYS